jgi:hypothetical protein
VKNPFDAVKEKISGAIAQDVAKQAGAAGDAAVDSALKQAPVVDALVNGEQVSVLVGPIVIPVFEVPVKLQVVGK